MTKPEREEEMPLKERILDQQWLQVRWSQVGNEEMGCIQQRGPQISYLLRRRHPWAMLAAE
jgi:hypothetical protein